ncbi:MAG: hypothetical protein CL670_04825 [Balneola sp.]|jgi:chromosome segregation ATPase|nr:hypothetical protein [Balneola sp.]MBE78455.1 hypothetical protein [Balneola sp.]|tara:strand:+ start:1073 stop:1627 length:555 start_codon:yes stop_codon:yes gene_type:complete
MNTEITNISELDSYSDLIASKKARQNHEEHLKMINNQLESIHNDWKQKKQALAKALANPNSKLIETEQLEQDVDDLKSQMGPLKKELDELSRNGYSMPEPKNKSGTSFTKEAVSVINNQLEELEDCLGRAFKICEDIAANEVVANQVNMPSVPYIHPAKDYISQARTHLKQSRGKWDHTYNQKN